MDRKSETVQANRRGACSGIAPQWTAKGLGITRSVGERLSIPGGGEQMSSRKDVGFEYYDLGCFELDAKNRVRFLFWATDTGGELWVFRERLKNVGQGPYQKREFVPLKTKLEIPVPNSRVLRNWIDRLQGVAEMMECRENERKRRSKEAIDNVLNLLRCNHRDDTAP